MKLKTVFLLVLVIAFIFTFAGMNRALAGPLPGAIFTTLEDGSRVNHNIYENKEDVYLDGGPPANAPSTAASLPEGDYYFQVTDPSGKVLLSTDCVKCRKVHVNSDGVIDSVYPATCSEKIRGKLTEVDCTHLTGIDIDHSGLGAITVQLMPYLNTPNKGGVYKVWITPVDRFVGDPNLVDNGYSPGNYHGFIPAWSKTDNFKVHKKPFIPPYIIVRKVNDSNANGCWDPGELEIGVDMFIDSGGWPVSAMSPLGVTNNGYTPWTVEQAMPEGTWIVSEDTVIGWLQTGVIIDGMPVALSPSVSVPVVVAGTSGESHEVIFLNVQLGEITACKGYDPNQDGVSDGPVEGFQLCLEGVAINGTPFAESCKLTGQDGCVSWADLLPGNYSVREILPEDWYATGPTSVDVELAEGGDESVEFLNYCIREVEVAMHTKGFWQNQGCDIVTAADLAELNSLAPYSGEFITQGMDNCGGVHCPELTILPFDTVNELGCYIVAPNSTQQPDPHLGLAQQLAAFILNMRHGLGDPLEAILPALGMSVQEVIEAAIAVWQSGSGVAYWQDTLTALNESGTITVKLISTTPCPVVYP